MLNMKDVSIENIDHLGIVAGIVDAIGLVEIINNLIGLEPEEKISAGHVVKAMIINGLGCISQPLYMFPKFFESIACEHLIGAGVKPEYLNDDKLGRVMDKLFMKGLDTIFLAISLQAVNKFQVSLGTSHLDSSSMHVHGEYNVKLPEVIFENGESENSLIKKESAQAINITYGYSRDHRPDLKQFLVELICSGDGDIPIYFKSASGNQTDSSSFAQIAVDYKKQIEVDSLIVADAALYTEENIKSMSEMTWLCRVPVTVKSAQSLVANAAESEFVKSKLSGYSFVVKNITYGGIEQRWLLVQSQARKKSDLEKLAKKITKAEEKNKIELKKLSQERFACEADAIKALSKLSKLFKYHQISQSEIIEVEALSTDKKARKTYKILATCTKDESKINSEMLRAGRFIIATNILDESQLSHEAMIIEYKAQQSCERGFAFLKNPSFFADSIYLKSPERIEALAMIMGLCLLVYTLGQRQIRAGLAAAKSTIKNQLGKATERPTMAWIFQGFYSIHLVNIAQQKHISNWTDERDFILRLLPEDCRHYYQFIT